MSIESDIYHSVDGESLAIYREKASKFIAIVFPVTSETEVKLKLETVKKNYHDANHHCYAYRLGYENQVYRFNDDGEPSGSAGKPIYGQILSVGISDVLIVVIRYFGGTKLGIPGLIHAYRTAARAALDNGRVVEKTIRESAKVIFSYEIMNQIMRIIKEEQIKIIRQTAYEECSIEFQVRKSAWKRVEDRMKVLKSVKIEQLDSLQNS
jgi:uncharacterized YigZ family protein